MGGITPRPGLRCGTGPETGPSPLEFHPRPTGRGLPRRDQPNTSLGPVYILGNRALSSGADCSSARGAWNGTSSPGCPPLHSPPHRPRSPCLNLRGPEGGMGPHCPGRLMTHFTCSWAPPPTPTGLIPFSSNSSQAPTEKSGPVWRNLTLGHEATRPVAVARPFPQKQEGSAREPLVLWSLHCRVATTQPQVPGGTTDRSHTAHPLCTH